MLLGGCGLPVENQNLPDRGRLYSDPATMTAALTGAVRQWTNGRQGGGPNLTLATMADSYTMGWNNFSMAYFSGEPRPGWDNTETGWYNGPHQRLWYGFYSMMSTANDLLAAIRVGGVSLDASGESGTATDRAEVVSVMLQGVALANLALSYDSGFVASEETAPEEFATLPVLSHQQLRDTALARFEAAITLAEATPFNTPPDWFGVPEGPVYSSAQLVRLMRTLGAELIAELPRNGAENGQADWAAVVRWASRGISAPPAFDFEFVADWSKDGGLYDDMKDWGNDLTTSRVDTRVARLLSPNQRHPWPAPDGNPPPLSADRRVGDGSYGPVDDYMEQGGFAATPNAGTDFHWMARENPGWPPARGIYHSSNMGRHRYDCASYYSGMAEYGGRCQVPLYTAAFNDLLWAEGLIRSNGDRGLAAALINKTRVGRGSLTALTGAESQDQLLAALQYEQEIEMMDLGPTVFNNRRRIDGLQPFTPRQMPIPFKELDLLKRELYTYGGPDHPDMSAPVEGAVGRIRNVRDIYREMEAEWWRQVRARRRF
jgi:hypothetical protein